MSKGLEIHVSLHEDIFEILRFNQYDKDIPITIIFDNYTKQEGDTIQLECGINSVVVLDTDVTFNDNIITFNLKRELTINAGRGSFNVAILNDNTRVSTFKILFEVLSNSIDEDSVTSAVVTTLVEQLNEAQTNGLNTLTNLNNAINTGDLSNYSKKTELEEYKTTADNTYVKQTDITQIQKDIINLMYPVGLYLDFRKNVDPNNIFTWQKWEKDTSGTVLVSCTNNTDDEDFGRLGVIGGSKTQKANLSNTAFAQIAIAEGSKRIQGKQVNTENWNATISITGSSADSTVRLTQAGINVAGTTNEFNNCMPYKTCCRWYRTA